MIVLIVIIMLGIIGYFIYAYYKGDNKIANKDILTTDMEIYIAQLQIKPQKNKLIKEVAKYLENIVMPNEKILAVETSKGAFGTNNFAIITDKRVIFENKASGVEIITPIEKIETVMQSGSIVKVNGYWINLASINKANAIVQLINNQVSSTQTLKETIKIENKIVTEENITSQLQKLSDLHKAGVLTDYEYSIKKQELLDKMK